MLHDLLTALRSLLRTPQLTAAVILSLGLGIGLNTAVFSVISAVLLRPLAYAHPEELVVVRGGLATDHVDDTLLPGAIFAEIKHSATQLKDVAAVAAVRQNLTGAGLPSQVQVGWISTNLFRMLGVTPALGRDFALDEPPGRILLAHDFWVRQFGSDPAAVGRRVFLDGFAYEIVGVMPVAFRLDLPRVPTEVDVWKAPDTWWHNGDVWGAAGLSGGVLRLVGRLRPEAGVEAARAELQGIGARLREGRVEFNRAGFFLTADPLHAALVSRVRTGLWLLLAAAGAVLLVACANVMNLQLVRGQRRRREVALRLAMGASRARVVRQALLEAVLLSLLGGALGLALGQCGLGVLDAVRPPDLPLAEGVRLDPLALAFATALCLGATFLFGLGPALTSTRVDPARELHGGRATQGPGRQWASASLVSIQVAMSLALILGLGLLGRSLIRLYSEPLGFSGNRLLTFTVSLPGTRYQRPLGPDRFLGQLKTAIEALPGARSVGSLWPLPFSGRRWGDTYEAGTAETGHRAPADYRLVTPSLFDTISARLAEGRTFVPGDSDHTVVVSRGLAEHAFPKGSALGRVIRARPWGGPSEAFEIVGVVDDQRDRSRREAPLDAVYFNSRGWSWTDWEIGVVVRAEGDPMALVEPIRRELARLDQEVPMADVRTMEDRVSRDVAGPRFALSLLGAFAGIGLILAMVGIHGVVAWNVVQRTREIGIRMALGATRRSIVRAVVGRAAIAASMGCVSGLALAAVSSRMLSGLVYGSAGVEVDVVLSGLAVLLVAACGAAYVPARRAIAVDPALTLRAE